MKTTLKDIALRVGVSKSLVSMYLNNHPLSARIADSTKRKIDEAIRETGYRPSQTARSLSKGKSKTIGLVIGNITGFFSSYIASGLLNEARKYGYQLLLALTRFNQQEERECLYNLMDRQVDGILYMVTLKPDEKCRRLLDGYPVLTSMPGDYNSLSPALEEAFADCFVALQRDGCHHLLGLDLNNGSDWECTAAAFSQRYGFHYTSLNRQEGDDDDTFYHGLLAQRPDVILALSSTPIKKFLSYCRRNAIRALPKIIYSYTLPCDFICHEAIYGVIAHDVQTIISARMARIIEMIEHPSETIQHLHFPSRFLSCADLHEVYEHQLNNPDFNSLMEERNILI